MKLSLFGSLLVGAFLAIPLTPALHNSQNKRLTTLESSEIRGAIGGFVWVSIFSKCGTAPECAENLCPDEHCIGFKTSPIAGAVNKNCSDPDWLFVCETLDDWILGEANPICAHKGGGCFPVPDEDGNVTCKEVIGNGFVIEPSVPDHCGSVNILDILL